MDVNQKFCLKWNNFQSSVTSVFDHLRQDEELVDITLCCEGKKIKAHRMMLSACSPYFRDLLKENPCQHPVFFLKDTSYVDLAAVVEFVYKGEVNVTQSQLTSFLKTAEMLQVRGLAGEDGLSPPLAAQTPAESTQHQSSRRGSAAGGTAPSPPAVKRRRLSAGGSSDSGPPSADSQPAELVIKQERLDSDMPDGPAVGSDSSLGAPAGAGYGLGPYESGANQAAADATSFLSSVSEQGGSGEVTLQPSSGPPDEGAPLGGRRWSCHLCGKHYQHSISLSQHMSVHRGHTTCRLCSRVFSRVAKLNDHLERAHGVLRRARRPRQGSPPPPCSPLVAVPGSDEVVP